MTESTSEKKIAPQDLEVHAGMVRLRAHDLQVYDVQDTLCHEQYNPPDNTVHDIVLIRTTKPFEFSAVVQRIKITRRYELGLDVTISGWGSTTDKSGEGKVSELLQYGDTFTLHLEDCKQRLAGYPTDKFLSPGTGCIHTRSPSSGPRAWTYDAGASVVHRGRLLGVVTRANLGAHVEGYVSVPHHLDWIRRQVARED